MLIDMHAHSAGISKCCKADAKDIIAIAQQTGIQGLILCNHYDADYVTSTPAEFAERYVNEYYYAAKCAREVGMKLFFGVEVTARKHERAHILIYGMPPEFVLENPEIYDYSLSEIYPLVKAKGGLVVQAHPYRGGKRMQDLNFLDGIEINCHPTYDSTHCDEMQRIAREAGKIVTCGGDYHADVPYRPVCGVYFPDEVETGADIVGYLKKTRTITMHVHELRTDFHRDVEYLKP